MSGETNHLYADSGALVRRLLSLYVRVTAWYLLAVGACWLVGIEGIYRHPTPFYAYPKPVFDGWATPLFVFAAGYALFLLWTWGLFREGAAPRWRVIAHSVALAAVVGIAGWLMVRAAAETGLAEAFAAMWAGLRWHLLVLGVLFVGLAAWRHVVTLYPWFGDGLPVKARRWMLVALIAFCILFSSSVAMIREGTAGITAAYDRHAHEYIDDIGRGGSIRGLFRDYVKIHPYLSTHAKVHPPGPIVLLWLLADFIAGREALGLSIATIVAGCFTLIPLYLWMRDVTDQRVALTACLLYAAMPTYVLFTATSADILFMPFTMITLFLFGRAIERGSIAYALAAGVFYGILSLLSFSLIGVGAYFGFVGLWKMAHRGSRLRVVKTAVLMLAAFLAVHLAVRWWSGFDVIACFKACKAQFDEDQLNLDIFAPRYPGWVYRFLNPACWAFFAGIPITVLFVWRLARPEKATKALFLICALTLLVLDVLYLARGEGERSAMYVLPFALLPAAHLLDRLGQQSGSHRPLLITLLFLTAQTWAIECLLYTYW